MALIRPELRAAFHRWREVLIGAAVCALGVWVLSFGGVFFQVLGAAIAVLGGGLGFVAARRLRFGHAVAAPGVVEVVEGQISYLAPAGGGFVALGELSRIRHVFSEDGDQFWLLSQRGAPDLAVPVDAVGSDDLFDAFVSLPGAEPRRILMALDRQPDDGPITVWRPPFHVALT